MGGYEASCYLDENDSQDSVTISGIVTEAKTKRKVPNAEIRFLDSEGNTIKKVSSDADGSFSTKIAKLTKFGSIEIDGDSAGFLTIANIDFGIFVNNTRIKARLFCNGARILQESRSRPAKARDRRNEKTKEVTASYHKVY